ncbi:MAG: extracellular solute-binding protein, partial [Acidimicrobiales bacterium]
MVRGKAMQGKAIGVPGVVGLALAATCALAASGGAASAAKSVPSSRSTKTDVTINVAIAYPAPPTRYLEAFTRSTGIKVNYSYIQWDNLQTKIAAAAEAHTYFADVADVDWSKVGEYY